MSRKWIKCMTQSEAETRIWFFALLVFVVCAVFSSGFAHPDEHFQILEFAKWKLDGNMPSAMAWEHRAMIRPTLQPVVCMAIIQLCRWAGMDNPFHQVMMMRLLTGMAVLWALRLFLRAASSTVEARHRRALMVATLFFWVVPVVSVHFSSETCGTVCLLLLLAGVLQNGQPSSRMALWLGIVAALGFEFRYQMAFAYIGIMGWIIVVGRYGWRTWLMAAVGFLSVVALCSALDCWFYGRMVFAPYNYYYMNIVEHVAAMFGESPWYAYLVILLFMFTIMIGIVVLAAIVMGSVRHYRNPVVWTFWTFLLLHSMISHKEMRFIYPLVPLLPLFVVWSYEMVAPRMNRWLRLFVVSVYMVINAGGLLHVMLKPIVYGSVDMMQYLCERAENHPGMRIKALCGSNPFRNSNLDIAFYQRTPVTVAPDEETDIREDDDVVVMWQGDVASQSKARKAGYHEVYRSIPRWQNVLNRFYHTYDEKTVLVAYER